MVDKRALTKILTDVGKKKKTVSQALEEMRFFPFEDMGFAKFDTHREIRKGFPEVVFCKGKSTAQVAGIFRNKSSMKLLMATRATPEMYDAVRKIRKDAVYFSEAGILLAGKKKRKKGKPVLVITAGTSDIPVAEEAAVTAEIMGNRVDRVYDIGVAGIHRLLANKEKIMKANVLVVAAGMDGVLPGIVGGLAARPVIAVPTSVGYGASFNGLAALLTMLNACAPGISVVNIDNGFGAGYLAGLINSK
ncbi:MAG: nickel pincer cofactor biosynthesis protein LarB [Candidatus Omnitrophota bacterium]